MSGSGGLLHETGHQWCCYVGDNFAKGEVRLGIIQENMHWYVGLESPYQRGTPMNAQYWIPNNDGTYRIGQDSTEPLKYHPFQLYFMGLYTKDNFDFDKKFTIYHTDIDMNEKATPYKELSINDIIDVEGERKTITDIDESIPPSLTPPSEVPS